MVVVVVVVSLSEFILMARPSLRLAAAPLLCPLAAAWLQTRLLQHCVPLTGGRLRLHLDYTPVLPPRRPLLRA
ncbi:hypothetical protein E2C01_075101 [Portunus trituberculatus]|uniref:Uncharacterized protein n=1 Tax=Portunus trituberculatus TaxID=210409 RepID=A0A5B7I581_PORTR|nr:hypothetical protein [Portunus trituberculatus]